VFNSIPNLMGGEERDNQQQSIGGTAQALLEVIVLVATYNTQAGFLNMDVAPLVDAKYDKQIAHHHRDIAQLSESTDSFNQQLINLYEALALDVPLARNNRCYNSR